MKCIHCGFESEQDFSFCPSCGDAAMPAAEVGAPAAQKILAIVKDPLFLVICILMSACCLVLLSLGNLPLLEILFAVFLWLTYAKGQKDIADAEHLRCVSGVVYAQYVISYVTAGLIVVMGIIFDLAFGALISQTELLESLLSDFVDVSELLPMLAAVPSGLIMSIFFVIGITMVVVNIFSLRYIHRFAQSVYRSILAEELQLRCTKATKIWMYIIGVSSLISAMSTLGSGQTLAALSGGAAGAMAIIAGLLIRKHLQDIPQE